MKKIVGWLLLIPILDFISLLFLGKFIGSTSVFLWLIGTLLIGIYIMRSVWITVSKQAKEQLNAGKIPDLLMIEGLAFFLIGFLLVIPGPLSDLCAFFLLIKPIRNKFIQLISYIVMKKLKGNIIWTGFIKK